MGIGARMTGVRRFSAGRGIHVVPPKPGDGAIGCGGPVRGWLCMMAAWRTLGRGLVASMALVLAGCASSGGLSTAALPKLPDLPKVALPEAPPPVVGTATEVYERIGRGAMACWFGANGPLKPTHIYEAEAEPPSKGGKAQIILRERDQGGQNPRGVKAFQIAIAPAPSGEDQTVVQAENFKLPPETAERMKKSVQEWSIGNHGCDPEGFRSGWAAAQGAAAQSTAETAPKTKTTQPKAQVAKPKQ